MHRLHLFVSIVFAAVLLAVPMAHGASPGLEFLVANRGNVIETFARGCVSAVLLRRGRAVARLAPTPRQFLPRTRGIAEVRYGGRARGRMQVQLRGLASPQCARLTSRIFRIRLS